MMAGAFVAKHFLAHMEPRQFQIIMDCAMFLAGMTLLWSAVFG
jgi:hypothetical protein